SRGPSHCGKGYNDNRSNYKPIGSAEADHERRERILNRVQKNINALRYHPYRCNQKLARLARQHDSCDGVKPVAQILFTITLDWRYRAEHCFSMVLIEVIVNA